MNANWPKEKKEGNRKEKRGEIEKRKKDAVNSPQQNRSETTTAITNKIENYILNYQCCFIMCIYKLLDCYRIIHCIGPRKLKFFSECFCKYENAYFYLHLDVISILILEKLAKICLCSHALTLLNNKRTNGL